MKKLLIFLLAVITAPLFGQGFSFAPKIGVNLATMTNFEGKLKPGVNVGLTGEYKPMDSFGIEVGAFYSMQGTKEIGNIQESNMDFELDADYINVPIYAKAYIGKGFNIFAGPQFGFKVYEKSKINVEGVNLDVETDALKPFDFSIGAGLGYQFETGFLISANYNYGLTNALNTKSFEEADVLVDSSHHGVIQFNVGWKF